MNPIDQFAAAQFASDECGDTMWNEENLNPPLSNMQGQAKQPSTAELEMQRAALAGDVRNGKERVA